MCDMYENQWLFFLQTSTTTAQTKGHFINLNVAVFLLKCGESGVKEILWRNDVWVNRQQSYPLSGLLNLSTWLKESVNQQTKLTISATDFNLR